MRKTIFDATELEKQKILEQHNFIKKTLMSAKTSKMTISEQAVPVGTDLLNLGVKLGCKFLVGGIPQVVRRNPDKPTVLLKIADYDSKNGYFKQGDKLYIKSDYTFDVIRNVDGEDRKIAENKKWACPELEVEIEKIQKGEQTKVDTAINTEIDYNKTQGGWKRREDIKDSDENVNNPSMYQTKTVQGVKLYRNLIDSGVVGAEPTSKGATLLATWRNKGWVTKDQIEDPDVLQGLEPQKKLVIPKDMGLFPEDLYMYPDPSLKNWASVGSSVKANVSGKIPTDIAECKTNIKEYYTDFANDRLNQGAITPAEVESLKRRVQACKYEFCKGENGVKKGRKCNGEWGAKGGLLGAGKKEAEEINKYVDMMSGLIPGGPSSGGEGKTWRLY